MVSADKAARSFRLSTIRYSSMLWISPPRTPIVSTTGTPQAAMLLPSQTPPRRLPADGLAEVGAGLLDQLEQGFRFRRHRLGRAAEAAMHVDCDVVLRGNRRDRLVDHRPGAASSSSGVAGRRLTRRIAMSGTTLFGAAAVDPRRVDREARPAASLRSRSARSAAASKALRPSSGLRPAWAERPWMVSAKLPLPGRAPASVPSGKRGGLVGQRRVLAARRLGDQRRRAGRADLLVAVDHHLVAEARPRLARLDRLQRREHHRDAALHVGDAGAVEHAVLEPARLLERVVGARTPCPCGR